MEIISYEYNKRRDEFGHHPNFAPAQPELSDIAPASEEKLKEAEQLWVPRIASTVELDCIPDLARHAVNTERFTILPKGTQHTEGAWPVDMKTTDFADKQRLLRRFKNDPSYQSAVVNLCKVAEGCVTANNTLDLFEEYFDGQEYNIETCAPPSARTVSVFRDPNEIKRQATSVSWHPEGPNKLAVSYSMLSFQQMPPNMPIASYIWDVNSPNEPDQTLIPKSPLVCLEYNPRSPDHIVGGCYNGLVSFWDLRKGDTPVEISNIDQSHHDPVYGLHWIQSRTGNELCSVSTDGQLLWWDVRKLKSGPTDSMRLQNPDGITFGGMSMEYKSEAGATRYLVGTEQGVILLCDRKAKKDAESTKAIKSTFGLHTGRHHAPIYSVQRNPMNLKYFLTVGDWTARVWSEDLRSPIMTTRYDRSYLTGGCWSPVRPGVFYTTKADGTLDAWDLFHKQSAPTFSTKVSDTSLSCIRVESKGNLVAIGSDDGTATILHLSNNLSEPLPQEKTAISAMFERETKREKNLEMNLQRKNRDRKKDVTPAFDPTLDDPPAAKEAQAKAEAEFYASLGDNQADAAPVERKEPLETKSQTVIPVEEAKR